MGGEYRFESLNFMREWMELGDKTDNPYMRFMAYWVAFNMLYLPQEMQSDRTSERHAIKRFFQEFKEQLSDYRPFENGDANFFKGQALSCLFGNEEQAAIRKKLERKDAEALLLTIYKIRCNFFHGNKKLNNPEDEELVKRGAIIIRGYLKAFGV